MEIRMALAVLSLAMVCQSASPADKEAERTARFLLITSVHADLSLERITIRGRNFGDRKPRVSLADTPLQILSWSREEVVAALRGATVPGTYLLVLTRGRGLGQWGAADVAIGTGGVSGPAGPTGPPGPTGPGGLQGPPGAGVETGQIRGALVACAPTDFRGAVVYVPGESFNSFARANGSFRLSYLPPGTYEVAVDHNGNRLTGVPSVSVADDLETDIGDVQTTNLDSDPAHCGTCGNACSVGAVCADGVCGDCTPTPPACRTEDVPDGCGGTSPANCAGHCCIDRLGGAVCVPPGTSC